MATDTAFNKIVRDKTIIQQAARIRVQYPQFKVSPSRSGIVITGSVQPTPRSVFYDFRISYELEGLAVTTIAEGQLERNAKGEDIPHMFGQKSLCLYRRKYGQFSSKDLIADTIVPWMILWLYHYENWHVTGKWQGGGEHPGGKMD